jgi:mRNA-degrading endonuclease RelE of RelBE toxin-antitoxin system
MLDKPITVAELPLFIRLADAIWDEGERQDFVDFIAFNPESGDIIPGTGGVRKVRWSRAGSGKRGGARVVYFYFSPDAPLFLILAYAKAEREDMTPDQKKIVADFAAQVKAALSAKGKKK